jgi:hypothetical protein
MYARRRLKDNIKMDLGDVEECISSKIVLNDVCFYATFSF